MKLFVAPTSPYVRKVRLAILEKGLADRFEFITANPYETVPALVGANPLGKVPALVLDDGRTLFDSPVLCAYVDSLTVAPILIPEGPARWPVLAHHALTSGITDAAYATVMEGRRPESERSANWLGRWEAAINRSLDAVEADMAPVEGDLTLAHLGLGAALGYLDFRLPDMSWRTGRSKAAAWYDAFADRPAMRATAPENA